MRAPKLYINGFPKSGLHLADRMALGMLAPLDDKKNWYGTNAWSMQRHNLEKAAVYFGALRPGQFIKGHSGYLKSLEALLVGMGVGIVCVYRDLRDVVVSQYYHVISDNIDLMHPGAEYYKSLPDKESVMLAIINGTDEWPGIFERWADFAGWLESPYVLPVKFEHMVGRQRQTVGKFFDYVYSLYLSDNGTAGSLQNSNIKKATVAGMMVEMNHTESSTTYRKGKPGAWRYEFTAAVKDAFKAKDDWLIKLGYAKNKDW